MVGGIWGMSSIENESVDRDPHHTTRIGFLCHLCNVSDFRHTAFLWSLIESPLTLVDPDMQFPGGLVGLTLIQVVGVDHSPCRAH